MEEIVEKLYLLIEKYNEKVNIENDDVKHKELHKFLASMYEEYDICSLHKGDKDSTYQYIKQLLEEDDGIYSVLKKLEALVDNDNILSEIDDTVMFFYDKCSKDICKQAVIEKYGVDIDDIQDYWDMYVDIRTIADELEILNKSNISI